MKTRLENIGGYILFIAFIALLLIFWLFSFSSKAQGRQPVTWSATTSMISKNEAVITFNVTIDEPWHIYSQFMEEGGPLPTTFTFVPSKDYKLIGGVKELHTPVEKFDPTF